MNYYYYYFFFGGGGTGDDQMIAFRISKATIFVYNIMLSNLGVIFEQSSSNFESKVR